MKIYKNTLLIEGADIEGENPLPIFRAKNHDRKVPDNGSLSAEQKLRLGYEVGERFLPYHIQDRYNRNRKMTELKTIVLENDILTATFLPDYGGRLYSLRDKRNNNEILYKNPIFQPANLAILNAWFSGGIEWNIGQLGHAFTTCSPVHAAKLTDEKGNEFLRIYDYERCKGVFWKIDFHLPKGSDKLLVYVQIINDNESKVPMYWWTNIAIKETERTRVFSSTPEVIYIDHSIKGFGAGKLPYLKASGDIDATYPMKIPFASEYFFQTDKNYKAPWEAAAYEDGSLFFERSTDRLKYRKMFCWGNHSGGKRWRDFLSRPDEGNYVEVQGGLAPTQLHGIDMPSNTIWDFTQIIGAGQIDNGKSHIEDWNCARSYIEECINDLVSVDEIYEIHERLQSYSINTPEEILNVGSGWGALEKLYRKVQENREIPKGFCFDAESVAKEQSLWIALIKEGKLRNTDVNEIPLSWMVQSKWQTLLENSLENRENHSWNAFMHLGIMLYERGEDDKAIEVWKHSLELEPSQWVYRNLSEAMKRKGETKEALRYYEAAYSMTKSFPDKAFYEEYISLLIMATEFQKAWDIYVSLPENLAGADRIKILMGPAAYELDKESFMQELFSTEFAVLREGETSIVDLWYNYSAKKLSRERNIEITDELMKEVKEECPPPINIDFRMFID